MRGLIFKFSLAFPCLAWIQDKTWSNEENRKKERTFDGELANFYGAIKESQSRVVKCGRALPSLPVQTVPKVQGGAWQKSADEGNYFARAQRARKQKGKLIILDVFRSQTVSSDAAASNYSYRSGHALIL